MGCERHHKAYDAHEFDIEPTTDKGLDGPFRVVINPWDKDGILR